MATFEDVQRMVQKLGLIPENINEKEQMFTVTDMDRGINNLVIDLEDPILILQQVVLPMTSCGYTGDFLYLLRMNMDLVHGAYAITENYAYVVWRDTLRLEHLDTNELEGSIKALELGLAEHANNLLTMGK